MMARSAEEVEGARLQTQSVENPHEQRFAAPHLPARARGHTHTTALRGEVICRGEVIAYMAASRSRITSSCVEDLGHPENTWNELESLLASPK